MWRGKKKATVGMTRRATKRKVKQFSQLEQTDGWNQLLWTLKVSHTVEVGQVKC